MITYATAQGNRPYQEDRYVIHPTLSGVLLGVMDGHGGSGTAEYVAQHLGPLWDTHDLGVSVDSDKSSFDSSSNYYPQVFDRIFKDLNEQTKNNHAGAAVSLVFIEYASKEAEGTAHVAILGDAPVLIRDNEGVLSISPEHNVRSNMEERRLMEQRGGRYKEGYIFFGYNGLQMSRALGDSALFGLIRLPETYSVPINKNSYVLIGSDGLFDPAHFDSNLSATQVDRLVDSGYDADKLVKEALQVPTNDNVTAVLWTPSI